ncbi:GNAT family N-acetyltransferase [Deinococcus rubellus]|uniref:GNAT family N-acetyltransferase n=1 Tax=Deinococcus rubellus TaxID=1889240 RepID=A0ABY5YJQ9_9DEIO|nr:GNAT family N-acetyltransferase [Deinococcus rubellus]UWX65354.1 GNAT family N-acetyltransferase [Deinococcus rubellus]
MSIAGPGQHPLDNPIWHALTGPQVEFALGGGPLRFFAPEVAPFTAFEERDEAALISALADPAAVPAQIVLFRPQLEPAPAGWTLAYQSGVVQMVCPDDSRLDDSGLAESASVVRLGPADLPEMLELVALAQPGPFGPRTPELGAYFGVREGGRLVALTGERLRLGGFTEVSAVCTHPDWRGRGLARRTVSRVARKAFSEQQTPFLHVIAGNVGAIRLYGSLGFVERARLQLSVWGPV